MRDQHVRILPAILAVTLLAGCTSATAGSPTAAQRPSQTTTSGERPKTGEPDRHGAPRVTNPLDATRYFTDPCAAIPPAQRPGLGLTGPGKPNTTGQLGTDAPSCGWVKGGQGGAVAFLKRLQNGLADLYRRHTARPEAYFEETTVEGYPAVFAGTPDLRSRGNCVLEVGLNDALAMQVIADGRAGSPVCERAKQIAAVAVKTIKGEG